MCEVAPEKRWGWSVQYPRSQSVYGGAGGYGTRISTRRSFDYSGLDLGVGLYYNEKLTMQNLNERLATYLDQVRSLEKANAELELKIKEWLAQRIVVSHDYTRHQAVIEDMYLKIRLAFSANAKILSDTRNAELAAGDFRMKYESELSMRQLVMADNASLRTHLDQCTVERASLEHQVEERQKELILMKRKHMEEIAMLKLNLNPNVDVEVDGPPQEDLGQVLEDMRIHYETIIQKNAREVELWYQKKIAELQIPKCGRGEELDELRMKISELRRSVQKLEIELHSSIRLRSSLEVSLQETQARICMELSQLQLIITSLENDVSEMHADIKRQGSDYKLLLDIRIRLEMEIAEYRRLLEGNTETTITDTKVQVVHIEPQKTKRIRTIEEVIVDGKVVSHEEEVEVENMN